MRLSALDPLSVSVHVHLDLVVIHVVEVHEDIHAERSISHPVVVVRASGSVLVGGSHHCASSLDVEVSHVNGVHLIVEIVSETRVSSAPVEG